MSISSHVTRIPARSPDGGQFAAAAAHSEVSPADVLRATWRKDMGSRPFVYTDLPITAIDYGGESVVEIDVPDGDNTAPIAVTAEAAWDICTAAENALDTMERTGHTNTNEICGGASVTTTADTLIITFADQFDREHRIEFTNLDSHRDAVSMVVEATSVSATAADSYTDEARHNG